MSPLSLSVLYLPIAWHMPLLPSSDRLVRFFNTRPLHHTLPLDRALIILVYPYSIVFSAQQSLNSFIAFNSFLFFFSLTAACLPVFLFRRLCALRVGERARFCVRLCILGSNCSQSFYVKSPCGFSRFVIFLC